MPASWTRRALTVTFASVAALALPPAVALARVETATSAGVTATFTFPASAAGTYPTKTLAISRFGQAVYDEPVTSSYCGSAAVPTTQRYRAPGYAGGRRAVHVVPLEAGTGPDGLIAAWAADEDSPGHTRLVTSTLTKYLRAGELHGLNYASGPKFIKALNRLLRKDGYVR